MLAGQLVITLLLLAQTGALPTSIHLRDVVSPDLPSGVPQLGQILDVASMPVLHDKQEMQSVVKQARGEGSDDIVTNALVKRAGDQGRSRAIVASTSRSQEEDPEEHVGTSYPTSSSSSDLESGVHQLDRDDLAVEVSRRRQQIRALHERNVDAAMWALKAASADHTINRGLDELGYPRTPFRRAGVAAASGLLATDALREPIMRGVGRCVGAMCNTVRSAYSGRRHAHTEEAESDVEEAMPLFEETEAAIPRRPNRRQTERQGREMP